MGMLKMNINICRDIGSGRETAAPEFATSRDRVTRFPVLTALGLVLGSVFSAWAQPDPTNCYAWFKGDVGITAGAAVANWPNQATSGANPAARTLDRISGTPTGLAVITPGGVKSVLRCDGADAVWGTSANFGSLTSNRTLVVFCRLTSTNDGFLFDGSTAGGMTRAQVRGGSWQAGLQPSPIANGANADPNTLPATNAIWQTHIFSFEKLSSSTRVTHTIAGGGSFTYTNSQTVGLGGLIVGRNVSAALGLAVDVAELLVFDRTPDATEQTDLISYLQAKWGSPTDVPAQEMTFDLCTAVQTNRTVPNFGLHPVLDAQVVTTGSSNAISLTNLTFTLAGSTDAAADVAAVKVYFTGTVAQFRTLTPFASYSGPMTGTISVAGNQPLQEGTNHFWIAVEPKPRTPWGRVLDAELTSVSVTGTNGGVKLPAVGAPPEFLTIGNAPFYTVLRARGDDGSFCFRIPGLAVTTNGTLISVFDIRWDSSADLPANIDVGCLRSTDLGNTWGPMITVLDYDKNVAGSSGNGVGDPTILVDRETGTIWVAAFWSYGNHAYSGSGTGTETNQTGQYVLTRSDDDGLTWSAPINITTQAKINTNWGACFNGPGNGIQLRDGTLVIPSQHTLPGGSQAKAFFLYSTNHGASWQASSDCNTNASPQLNENQIVELNSGQLMISSRVPGSTAKLRAWSTYTPGASLGDGGWSPLTFTNNDPICQASFIRYSSTLDGAPRDRLLFSNPNHASSRINQTIRMSEDEGQTWTVARQIDTRAGYSSLAVLPDGTVGLFYEAPANYDMVFARFSLDWLTQADVDSDSDGMSDYYEGINGLTNGVNDAALDLDGDGQSNLEEFRAGTMANSAASVFKITAVQLTNSTMTVTWNSVPYRHYAVEAGDSLSAPNWTVLPGADDLMARTGQHSFSLPVGGDPAKFIRIRALAY